MDLLEEQQQQQLQKINKREISRKLVNLVKIRYVN